MTPKLSDHAALVLGFFACFALIGCEQKPLNAGAELISVAPTESYVHPTAGIEYPPEIAGFKRETIELQSKEGALGPAVSVEYTYDTGDEIRIQADSITTLWFPAETEIETIAPHCFEDVLTQHLEYPLQYQVSKVSGAKVIDRADYDFIQSGINVSAKRASYAEPHDHLLGDDDILLSSMIGYSRGLHVVVMRLRYHESDKPIAEERIREFLEDWDTTEFDRGMTQTMYENNVCSCEEGCVEES